MKPGSVDLAHLARYTGGDAALNSEVLRLFDSQAGEMVGRLDAILEARDAKSWVEIAHTLKGAAGGIGAFALADAAALAEPIDPANTDQAVRALAVLRREAEAVRRFIREYLKS